MIGKICGVLFVISLICGVISGNTASLGESVVSGASSAVELTLSLTGMMCLWCGVMRVARETGFVERMTAVISPVLRFLFPDAYKKQNGTGEIAASVAANFIGIGNASTPLAIGAMKKLSENAGGGNTASDDMIMFTVLGTASFDIFPTTLIALRTASDSVSPFEIILPVWICSFLTAGTGVLLVKIYCTFRKTDPRRINTG